MMFLRDNIQLGGRLELQDERPRLLGSKIQDFLGLCEMMDFIDIKDTRH